MRVFATAVSVDVLLIVFHAHQSCTSISACAFTPLRQGEPMTSHRRNLNDVGLGVVMAPTFRDRLADQVDPAGFVADHSVRLSLPMPLCWYQMEYMKLLRM